MSYLGSGSQSGSSPPVLPDQPDSRYCNEHNRAAEYRALPLGGIARRTDGG
jgi:hypothetical protein